MAKEALQQGDLPKAEAEFHDAERLATGDQRLSIEERYPTKETYIAAVKKAAEGLVAKRYLLPEDAKMLISQAERDGIRSAP